MRYNVVVQRNQWKLGECMRSGRASELFWIAALSLVAALPVRDIAAQVPGAVGQPQQRQERPDPRSPVVRESEDYAAKGIPLGGFKLFAGVEAGEVFNDNVYATSNATGKTATFIQTINPTLEMRSDWQNHMLNAYAKGGFGFYSVDGSLNNYQDISVGADARLDIQRNWNV